MFTRGEHFWKRRMGESLHQARARHRYGRRMCYRLGDLLRSDTGIKQARRNHAAQSNVGQVRCSRTTRPRRGLHLE